MKSSTIEKKRKILGTFIFILASLFLTFEMVLQVSPAVMTTELMQEFHIDATVLGVAIAFYFYSYAFMQIPSGLLYDRFGPRTLISIATALCALSSLFFGVAHSVALISLGRFLLGIGSAFAFVGALTVAARWFSPALFAIFVGIVQFIGMIGATCGALPLAYMINLMGWRSTMNILAIVGFVLSILCALFIRNRPPQDQDKDQDHHHHLGLWQSFKTVLSNGQTWSLSIYSFFNWAPALIFAALWGVPYLMTKYEYTNTVAAFAVSMLWIGVGVFSPLIGWLSDKLQRRNILLVWSTAIGLMASLILILAPSLPYFVICFLILILGGASSGNLICFAVAKDINRASVTSTAMGVNNMSVVLSGALFQPIVGFILSKLWDGQTLDGAPVYSAKIYSIAFTTLPLCYLISLIVSLFFIKETFCKSKYDPYLDQIR